MKTVFFFLLCLIPAAAGAAPVNEGVFGPDRLRSVLGQDGVTPIPVKARDGSEFFLWTFGDTILGGWKGPVVTTATVDFNSAADMKAMPSNTLAMTPVPSSANYRDLGFSFYAPLGSIREFIPCREGENPLVKRLWANDGIQLGGTIYVYYMDVELDKNVPGGFSFKGTGLSKIPVPAKAGLKLPAFKRLHGFWAEGAVIGDSVIAAGEYLYLLGRASRANDGRLTSLTLLRVRPADIEKLPRYEYLAPGGGWGGTAPGYFFDDVSGEASLVYDAFRKVFRITYMSFNSQEIMTAEFAEFAEFAKAPKAAPLYRPPAKKDALFYSAKELFSDAETVYLIYIDPSIYQPILVKVPR